MKEFIFKIIQMLTFSRIFWKKRSGVYLSFDDGPDDKNTPIILDILKECTAKATFFVVGEDADQNEELLKRIASEGHTVANHSQTHIRFENNLKLFLENIERCESVLERANVKSNNLVRIPYGIVDLKLFCGLLLKGYKIAFWNKDTKDYKLQDDTFLSDYMDIHSIQDGDIILLHDSSEITLQILKKILEAHSDKKFVAM